MHLRVYVYALDILYCAHMPWYTIYNIEIATRNCGYAVWLRCGPTSGCLRAIYHRFVASLQTRCAIATEEDGNLEWKFVLVVV